MKVIIAGIMTGIIFLLTCCQSDKAVVVENVQKTEQIMAGGSECVYNILKPLAEGFEAEHPGKRINFSAPGHTASGFKGVNEGILNIGAVSRTVKPEEKEFGLKEYWFAKDAIVFAVNPGVKLKKLSLRNIRAIYYGETTNWNEIGGADHAIVVLDRADGASTKAHLYEKTIFEKNKKITDRAIVFERPADMNTALASSLYSIGYTPLPAIIKDNYNLNVLELDGIAASPENIVSGKYPLVRPMGFVVKGEPSGLVKEFIDYIYSAEGHAVLTKYGYLPIRK